MAELRSAIDALDRTLVSMLAERAAYIDRAAELKSQNGLPARIGARVEEVVENARKSAEESGMDPDITEAIWRQLIDWSIAREEKILGLSTRAD